LNGELEGMNVPVHIALRAPSNRFVTCWDSSSRVPSAGIARTRRPHCYQPLACLTLCLVASLSAMAANQTLKGHIPAAVKQFNLQPVSRMPPLKDLRLPVGLPLRNQAGLAALLHELYDPSSPEYHHFLTPETFTERFSPTESDYATVTAFAQSNGLAVTHIPPNRLLVDVSGSVADIEKAFNVTLRIYQHPAEGRTFHAPDTEPSVPLDVP